MCSCLNSLVSNKITIQFSIKLTLKNYSMIRNLFHKNSSLIFKEISRKIADKALDNDLDVIHNTLSFAIGIEKLLKGILYDINPLFILENPEFKNAVPISYLGMIKNQSELNSNPNGDVIAFLSSVLRTIAFSNTAAENKNTLMKLKNARDIIVHHNFEKLDISELRLLLNRDYYPLLKSFSDEHNLAGQVNFFNNLHSKLALISSSLQDDIPKQIQLKIDATSSYWNTLKGSASLNMDKLKLLTTEKLSCQFSYPFICPSCKNNAVVTTKPIMEYNPFLKQEIQVGLQVLEFNCEFCKLKLTDYKELDFLKITPMIEDKNDVILNYCPK